MHNSRTYVITTYVGSYHCFVHAFSFIALLYLLNPLCLDSILNITLQPSGLDQNTVGQRQDVICSIFVPPDVDPNTIELGWLNEDDIITYDGRVTIDTSSDFFNDSTLITTIQFDPLTEEDEDEYICYAIINGSFIFESINLQNIISKSFPRHIVYVRDHNLNSHKILYMHNNKYIHS